MRRRTGKFPGGFRKERVEQRHSAKEKKTMDNDFPLVTGKRSLKWSVVAREIALQERDVSELSWLQPEDVYILKDMGIHTMGELCEIAGKACTHAKDPKIVTEIIGSLHSKRWKHAGTACVACPDSSCLTLSGCQEHVERARQEVEEIAVRNLNVYTEGGWLPEFTLRASTGGAMGKVHVFQHTASGYRVAMKVWSSIDKHVQRTVKTGRETLSKLTLAEGLVRTYPVRYTQGREYMVMEAMDHDGTGLPARFTGQLLALVVTRAMQQLVNTFSKVFMAGKVVYRDIKLQNVMYKESRTCTQPLNCDNILQFKFVDLDCLRSVQTIDTSGMACISPWAVYPLDVGDLVLFEKETDSRKWQQKMYRAEVYRMGMLLWALYFGDHPFLCEPYVRRFNGLWDKSDHVQIAAIMMDRQVGLVMCDIVKELQADSGLPPKLHQCFQLLVCSSDPYQAVHDALILLERTKNPRNVLTSYENDKK
jgi:hypothetical protein